MISHDSYDNNDGVIMMFNYDDLSIKDYVREWFLTQES